MFDSAKLTKYKGITVLICNFVLSNVRLNIMLRFLKYIIQLILSPKNGWDEPDAQSPPMKACSTKVSSIARRVGSY